MLATLIGLGTWQVHRLHWKQDILAQIDRAEANPPIPLPPNPAPYAKVSVTGTFLPDRSALYGAQVQTLASGPAMGGRLIVPLRMTDGRVVLIDRGWVPTVRQTPIDQPTGEVTVSGYVRFGDEPGAFSAHDDVPARLFYTLDPQAIGQALGQPAVLPFVLVVLGPERAGEIVTHLPDPATHLPRPPNNHLSYVITWYGLAAALVIIFIVWARKKPEA